MISINKHNNQTTGRDEEGVRSSLLLFIHLLILLLVLVLPLLLVAAMDGFDDNEVGDCRW